MFFQEIPLVPAHTTIKVMHIEMRKKARLLLHSCYNTCYTSYVIKKGRAMKVSIIYIPTQARMEDGIFWCEHPDTQTDKELNAWGDSILVTRCANCGAWYDEAFNTFDTEELEACNA